MIVLIYTQFFDFIKTLQARTSQVSVQEDEATT